MENMDTTFLSEVSFLEEYSNAAYVPRNQWIAKMRQPSS